MAKGDKNEPHWQVLEGLWCIYRVTYTAPFNHRSRDVEKTLVAQSLFDPLSFPAFMLSCLSIMRRNELSN